jgi:DNA-binding NtrC family response regulator
LGPGTLGKGVPCPTRKHNHFVCMGLRILLVENDASVASALQNALGAAGYTVVTVMRGDEGLTRAKEETFEIVITALRLPGMSGLELVRQLHAAKPRLPIIMMAAFGTTESAIEATKHGAFEYVTKPFELPALLRIVGKAAACHEPTPVPAEARALAEGKSGMVGSSLAMQRLYKEIGRAAKSSLNVLICGETGSGKELVARALHRYSDRAEQPFVDVNCTAIPDTLLESELFGHERGAFTNAEARRIGCFERAKRGTIFLDEIGDMNPNTQAKLLRVVQEKDFQRVGGNEKIKVEARIVSATQRDLHGAIEAKQFREDLFYRLNGITIRLPSLKERMEDIPELVNYFLHRFCLESAAEPPSIRAEALEFLQAQTWPGNVRELQNVIGYSLLLADHHPITLAQVQQACAETRRLRVPANRTVANYFAELLEKAARGELRDLHGRMLEDMERELFTLAIRKAEGNNAQAARWLGVSRRTLRERLLHFGRSRPGDTLQVSPG